MRKYSGGLFLGILICFSFISPHPKFDSGKYLEVKPKKGDGILALLRRYHLEKSQCDIAQFYKLNNLKKGGSLYSSKKYKLPIFIYNYNDESIRSTIGINNWDKAVRIRDYNNLLTKEGKKKDKYHIDKILLVPYRELYCDEKIEIEEFQPTGKRMFPIFGKKYAHTPLKSKKLKGKVFYVVSGHGGPDPGALGKYAKNTLCEDEYAYDVSLRLCRKLIEHGGTAYMVTRDENDGIRSGKILKCDTDERTWKNEKMFRSQKPRLLQRSNAVNRLYERHRIVGAKSQQMICIHIDSRSESMRTDVFFYHHPSSGAGKKLARKIRDKMKQKYAKYQKGKKYNGTVTARDLHMLRETKPTSVYVELGNIRNSNDQQRFILESNREALAKWLFEGMTGIPQ